MLSIDGLQAATVSVPAACWQQARKQGRMMRTDALQALCGVCAAPRILAVPPPRVHRCPRPFLLPHLYSTAPHHTEKNVFIPGSADG